MKYIYIAITFVLYALLFNISTYANIDEQKLRTKLVELNETIKVKKIDAYYDDIYKLVPGRDGYEIDIEQSIANMNNKYDETKIIYKKIDSVSIDTLKYGPIYKGNSDTNIVTLIINVAWGEEYVYDMLDILDKYNVKANFFCEGRWVEKNPTTFIEIVQRGHLIGNHSYSHADFASLSKIEQLQEITKTNDIISQFTTKTVSYFGPPGGSFTDTTLNTTNELDMNLILWTLDTIDWQKPSVSTIINRIVPKVKGGDIILMHPTLNTKDALEDIIISIHSKNLEIVDLDNFIYG